MAAEMNEEKDTEALLHDPDDIVLPSTTNKGVSSGQRFRWALTKVLWWIFLIVLGTLLRAPSWTRSDRDVALARHGYSPLLDAIEYDETTWSNDFDSHSIWRGPPSPQRETAWDMLWQYEPVKMRIEKARLLNHSGQGLAKVPGQNGSDVMVMFEVFHQLHCLNTIRQYTWLDHYSEPPRVLNGSRVLIRMHLDHCLETLRLALMCNADPTPVLITTDEREGNGVAGMFSGHHKCSKFDKLVDWTKEHQIEQYHVSKDDGLHAFISPKVKGYRYADD